MGTGRRKTSVARVRIKEGTGKFTVNGRELAEYLRIERDRDSVMVPLKVVGKVGAVDVSVRVQGGGPTGQTGAIVLGIARALQGMNAAWHHDLSVNGLLTRDDRMVERKKYGFRKARRSFQFSKR
jgi:small subunit ribosomal protein S9